MKKVELERGGGRWLGLSFSFLTARHQGKHQPSLLFNPVSGFVQNGSPQPTIHASGLFPVFSAERRGHTPTGEEGGEGRGANIVAPLGCDVRCRGINSALPPRTTGTGLLADAIAIIATLCTHMFAVAYREEGCCLR